MMEFLLEDTEKIVCLKIIKWLVLGQLLIKNTKDVVSLILLKDLNLKEVLHLLLISLISLLLLIVINLTNLPLLDKIHSISLPPINSLLYIIICNCLARPNSLKTTVHHINNNILIQVIPPILLIHKETLANNNK